jgi:hypothetical protein
MGFIHDRVHAAGGRELDAAGHDGALRAVIGGLKSRIAAPH